MPSTTTTTWCRRTWWIGWRSPAPSSRPLRTPASGGSGRVRPADRLSRPDDRGRRGPGLAQPAPHLAPACCAFPSASARSAVARALGDLCQKGELVGGADADEHVACPDHVV